MIEEGFQFLFSNSLDMNAGFSGGAELPTGSDYAEVGPDIADYRFDAEVRGVVITPEIVEDIAAYLEGEKPKMSRESLEVLRAVMAETDAANIRGITVALVAPDGSFVEVFIDPPSERVG